MPVRSEGRRSGVNCTRRKSPPMVLAKARRSMVLPVPGVSSSRTWPEQRKQVSTSSMASSLPTITFEQLPTTLSR